MSDLKVALIQSDLYWESIEANLANFEEQIWSIEEDVDVIILPEMFSTGFSMNPKKLSEVKGLKTHKWLLQMASQKQALVGGSYIAREGDQFYNRFFAAFPDGTYQTYDKKHLFSLAKEEEHFSAGSERLIIDYLGWKICPLICYDLRFPTWSQNQVDKSSGEYAFDLLLYVASWPKARIAAWDTLLKARAIENQSYTIGCNRVGEDGNGYAYVGHSGIYDYLGEERDKLENKPGILIQTLSQDDQKQFRTKFPFVADA